MKVLYVALFLQVLALLIFTTCTKSSDNQPQDNEIAIGVLLLGLNIPAYTEAQEQALTLAEKEINTAGGVLGKKLRLIIKYTEGESTLAKQLTRELIDEQKVKAIIGGGRSSEFLAIGEEVIKPNGVPAISPSATADSITDFQDNNMLWRTVPKDSFQAKIAAQYAIENNKKTAAILYIDNTYGQNLSSRFQTYYAALGGTILVSVPFPYLTDYSGYDFLQHLQTLMTYKPDMLYLVSYQTDGIGIITTLENKKEELKASEMLILGCDGNKNDNLLEFDFTVYENMIFVAPGKDHTAGSNYMKFIENYETEYKLQSGEYFSQYIENAYDALYLLAYAMADAGKDDPASIVNSLVKISRDGEIIGVNEFAKATNLITAGTDIDYDGASGHIEFNAAGDVTSATYEISKINRSTHQYDILQSVDISE